MQPTRLLVTDPAMQALRQATVRLIFTLGKSTQKHMKPEDVKSIKDAAAYFREHHGDLFTEAYHVCGAIEVVAKMRVFRIEPIEPIHTGPKEWNVRVYELERDHWKIWTNFAYCNRSDAASAMMQALSFLYDGLREK